MKRMTKYLCVIAGSVSLSMFLLLRKFLFFRHAPSSKILPQGLKPFVKADGAPDISITIPFLNEMKKLPAFLASLRNQRTDYSFEMIFVDHDSIDGGYEWLSSQPDVTVVNEKKAGISAARNRAVMSSSAQYILQTDADSVVPIDWVQKMGDAMIKDGADFVIGSVYFDDKNHKSIELTRKLPETTLIIWNAAVKYVPRKLLFDRFPTKIALGMNLGFTRDLFNRLGGYDEGFWMDDYDITNRAHRSGANVVHISETAVNTSTRRFAMRVGDDYWFGLGKVVIYLLYAALEFLGLRKKMIHERVDNARET